MVMHVTAQVDDPSQGYRGRLREAERRLGSAFLHRGEHGVQVREEHIGRQRLEQKADVHAVVFRLRVFESADDDDRQMGPEPSQLADNSDPVMPGMMWSVMTALMSEGN